ncbi:hypothetical protein [Desnuesiella massiliensis]|uniref:hypothetical protein n=1 Tax=Desnuesiella massiliensis TaxID=1650662 RepID=UPI0006E161F7|nr:hypothetical protein [Desnuesiella massiliensis]
MKKRFFKLLTSLLLVFSMLLPTVAKADITDAKNYIAQATHQKSFYYYNKAYEEIMKLQDGNEKNILLGQLAAITNDIWTEDIKSINAEMELLAKTGSGKIYDQIQVQINNAKINEIDKSYFLGEVTSWGRNLVFTEDYNGAVGDIIYLYVYLDTAESVDENLKEAIKFAEGSITKIKNDYSRVYLHDELNKFKKHIGMPISDKMPEYAGDEEKIVTIDNPLPKQNSTINITVKGKAGSTVNLLFHYKPTSTHYTGTIDNTGKVTIPVDIVRATIGYIVKVDVTISYNGTTTSEETSFIPVE